MTETNELLPDAITTMLDCRVAKFGTGKLHITAGKLYGEHAVFIQEGKAIGKVGGQIPEEHWLATAELNEGSIVLVFPNEEQAATVVKAVCGDRLIEDNKHPHGHAIASDKTDKMTHPLAPDTQKLVEVIEYVENALFLYGSRAYYLPEHIELVLEAAKSTISQPQVAGGDLLTSRHQEANETAVIPQQEKNLTQYNSGNPAWDALCELGDSSKFDDAKRNSLECIIRKGIENSQPPPQPEAANVAVDEGVSWILSGDKEMKDAALALVAILGSFEKINPTIYELYEKVKTHIISRSLPDEAALQTPASDGVLEDALEKISFGLMVKDEKASIEFNQEMFTSDPKIIARQALKQSTAKDVV